MIYFVRAESGQVKIGTTQTLDKRLVALKRLHGDLRLITTIPGGHSQERRIHEMLEDKRLIGEWFQITDEEVIAFASQFAAKKDNYSETTAKDFAGMLNATLAMAQEVGITIKLGNRAGGLLILLTDMAVSPTGQICIAQEATP